MTNIYGYEKEIAELKEKKRMLEKKGNNKREISRIDKSIRRIKTKIRKLRHSRLTKNKRGGTLYLGLLFAIVFFMIGMWMLPFMKDGATSARTNLDCTNSSISDGAKVTCLFVGVGVPYFIVVILTVAGGILGKNL